MIGLEASAQGQGADAAPPSATVVAEPPTSPVANTALPPPSATPSADTSATARRRPERERERERERDPTVRTGPRPPPLARRRAASVARDTDVLDTGINQ